MKYSGFKKIKFALIKIILLINILFASINFAYAENIVIDDSIKVNYINPYLDYFNDKSETLDFESVIKSKSFVPFDPSLFAYPKFPKGALWLKITIENRGYEKDLVLECQRPGIDYIDFYYYENGNTHCFQTGDYRNYDTRPIHHTSFAFPITAKNGINEFYICTKSLYPLGFPIYLYEKDFFYRKQSNEDASIGFTLGVTIMIVIAHLSIIFRNTNSINIRNWHLNEKFSISAVACMICALYALCFECGWTFKYFFPNAPIFEDSTHNINMMLANISVCFAMYFFSEIVSKDKIIFPTGPNQVFYNILKICVYLFITTDVIIIFLLLIKFNMISKFATCYYLLSNSTLFLITMILYRKSRRYSIMLFCALFYLFYLFLYIPLLYYISLDVFDYSINHLIIPVLSTLGVVSWSITLIIINHIHMFRKKIVEEKLIKKIIKKKDIESEFINSLTHELGTPINIIMDSLDELTYEIETSNGNDILNRLYSSAFRMESLINNVLKNAHMESPKFVASFSYQNIIPIIENVLFTLKPLLNKGNIRLTFNKPESENVFAKLDKIGIEHILLNLLQNSIKYTSVNGQIHIDIKTSPQKLTITIMDNGCGIVRNKEDIFLPYYRGENLSTIPSGIGLGLSIVKKWVEIHNGSIFYVSPLPDKYKTFLDVNEKNIGTVFNIYLPANGKN